MAMKKLLFKGVLIATLLAAFGSGAYAATFTLSTADTKDYILELQAQVQASPAQITISWPSEADGVGYVVYRKLASASSWGTPLASFAPPVTSYVDTDVSVGNMYEYKVLKARTTAPRGIYGYISSAIQAPVADSRGTVIVLYDTTSASGLSSDIDIFTQDLVRDGWNVITHAVARGTSVASVKSLILADYALDPVNTKSVVILGHVAVPYSGELNPDGHSDHLGSWPADVYYGDIDSSLWTDTTLTSQNPGVSARNQNIPGDGKFDQTFIPSNVELAVGRVDFYDMPAFAPQTEQTLLQAYLQKNHNFRMNNLSVPARAVVADGFGAFAGEAFAQSGWRNFSALVGSNITELPTVSMFPSEISTNAYLWAYAGNGAGFTAMSGIIATSNYAANSLKAVFSLMYGSYFGDWDSTNNLLRAPLASGYGLANMWSGRPLAYMQQMALGKTLGEGLLLTQNNASTYTPTNTNAGKIHIALMGDPTLRQVYVLPPSAVSATGSSSNTISWTASADADTVGYYIYRATSSTGPYVRVSPSIVTSTSYTDTLTSMGTYYYLVKTVALKTSPSGSYYDMSHGIPVTSTIINSAPAVTISTSPNAILGDTIALSAAVADDGFSGGPVTGVWSYTGPGIATIASAADMQTTATVDTAGIYTFTYTATDTILSGSNSASVHVYDTPSIPVLSTIPSTSFYINTGTHRIPFTVADADTAQSSLVYTVISGSTHIIPNNALSVVQTAAGFDLAVNTAPAALGTSTITVEVSDSVHTVHKTFVLTILTDAVVSNVSSGGGGGGGGGSSYIAPIVLSTPVVFQKPAAESSTAATAHVVLNAKGALLALGSKHDDIKTLQQFLNKKGFTISAKGDGSIGKETTFFGAMTKKALLAFQKKSKIPQTGKLDVKTRRYISSVAA